jgi:hypothetical protein
MSELRDERGVRKERTGAEKLTFVEVATTIGTRIANQSVIVDIIP